MQFRTFFFLLFIISSSVFFLSNYLPSLTLSTCGSLCSEEQLTLPFIQLTSMTMSAISLILYVITKYYGEKRVLREKERLATDRLNIEEIHAELEALKN